MSAAPRRAPALSRLTAPLLRLLNAATIDEVLAESAALLATLAGVPTAATFVIERDCAIHEGWFPRPASSGAPLGPELRTLAVDVVRAASVESEPRRLRPDVWARPLLLRSAGHVVGAVVLVTDAE